MHVLIVCAGSAGDVHPFIAIGESLKLRGHDVQLATAAPFRGKIERAGLGFIETSTQAEFDEIVEDPHIFHPRKSGRALFRRFGNALPSSYALLLEHIRPGETILVASSLGMMARLIQEKLGTKLATVHLAPSAMWSATDPATLAMLAWAQCLPTWAVRLLLALIERTMIDPLICPKLNEFRATLGLAPVHNIVRWINSPERVIGAFPAWFAAPQEDWPANTVCTTFPRLAASTDETLGDELQSFLSAGPPPIAFTPGSANAHGRRFFERALAATELLGMRAVLVTPYRDQLPNTLPPYAHHEPYVPFDVLAPHVSAFVHHGGIGTSSNILAAGKPQLITPFAYDQPDNAARLKKLGVADYVALNDPATTWARALSSLLNNPKVSQACRDIAARMQLETRGSEQIADLIEAFAA